MKAITAADVIRKLARIVEERLEREQQQEQQEQQSKQKQQPNR